MIRALLLVVLLAGAAAAKPPPGPPLSLDGHFVQGGLVVGRTAPGATVTVGGRRLRVSPEGVFVFGLGRDARRAVRVAVVGPAGRRLVRSVKVEKRRYRVSRIDGLPRRMVTPSAKDMKRIRAERARIAAARRLDTASTLFLKGFTWPAKGRISGVYGSQRILNGKPRRPHLGLDIAAPTGTPVVSAAPGTVSLAEPDLYFTGGTVIIDHGQGISSLYFHMSKILVAVGQRVAKGERIGAIGATGRATGPHLHWGVEDFDTYVDPAFLVGPMPK